MATDDMSRQGEVDCLIDEFIDILACPDCGGTVRREGDHLSCDSCGRIFPIVNGIPVMLADGGEGAES